MAIVLDYKGSIWFYLFKPMTTVLVILLPILLNEARNSYNKLLIAALCFCLLGDIFLLKPDYFVFGLGAFLVGHLLFIRGFISLEGLQKNGITASILFLIGIGLYAWLYKDLGTLKFPVAVYVLVILFMVWQAVSMYLKNKKTRYVFIALGALLFMFSDTLIAIHKFKNSFELSGVLILSTYWLAIAFLANSGIHATKNP